MPRLQIPDEKAVSPGQGRDPSAAASSVASGARLGQLQAGPAAEAVANRAKLGEIQSTQGAAAMAQAGQVGAIMQTQGARAAAAYADIGKSAANAGLEVMANGMEYFNKASGAIDDAIYNNAYADASKEFNQRVSERISKPFDDNGQPTFSSLNADIDKIGAEVRAKYGNLSPEAANRFNQSFTNLQTNQSILAMNEARKQQIDYSVGSLHNSLNASTTNALSGPKEMSPQYIDEANRAIDNAVKHGYKTYEEGVALKEATKKNINVGWIEIQGQKDPVAISQMLNNAAKDSGSSLGLTPMEYSQALSSNAKQLQALYERNKQQVEEEKTLNNEVYANNTAELKVGIVDGTIDRPELDQALREGRISASQYAALVTYNSKAKGDSLAKTRLRGEIGSAVNNGDMLVGKYSGSQIDDHFNYSVAAQGGNLPLFDPKLPMDEARIVMKYNAPVSAFTDKIAATMLSGSLDDVKRAAKAFEFVQKSNPLVVSSLTNDSRKLGLIVGILNQLKYNHGNADATIQSIQLAAKNIDPNIEEFRGKQFDNEDKFKTVNILNTVKDMYGDAPWLSSNTDTLPEYAVPVVSSLLKQNYIITGNIDDAIEATKIQTAGIIGTTEVNGGKTTMFMPPEYAYPQYANHTINGESVFKLSLQHDLAPILKKGEYADQSAVKPEDVEVRSGPSTVRTLGGAEYTLWNKKTGLPIIDPDSGQVKTWKPDGEYMVKLKRAAAQEKVNQLYNIYTSTPTTNNFIKGGVHGK